MRRPGLETPQAFLVGRLVVRAEKRKPVLDSLEIDAGRAGGLAQGGLGDQVLEDRAVDRGFLEPVVDPEGLRGKAAAAGEALEALKPASVALAAVGAPAAPGEGAGAVLLAGGSGAVREFESHVAFLTEGLGPRQYGPAGEWMSVDRWWLQEVSKFESSGRRQYPSEATPAALSIEIAWGSVLHTRPPCGPERRRVCSFGPTHPPRNHAVLPWYLLYRTSPPAFRVRRGSCAGDAAPVDCRHPGKTQHSRRRLSLAEHSVAARR